MFPVELENDTLSGLEERIQKAVELVARLRKEKDAALQLAQDNSGELARLTTENKALQAERKQVRARLEKLLGQIDQLSEG